MICEGGVAIITNVDVDHSLVVGLKSSCSGFHNEFNYQVCIYVKNLGEIKWYGGCHYLRDREKGTLTISQKTLVDDLVRILVGTSAQRDPHGVFVKLREFDGDVGVKNWPFYELVDGFVGLSISPFPESSNAV